MLFWQKGSLRPGIKVGLKGESCKILHIIPSFKFLLYHFFKKKSVKPGSSKILLAAHTYPSVEIIILGTIIKTEIMGNAFNNYVWFYIVPSYGC